jgi:hypothetical protein
VIVLQVQLSHLLRALKSTKNAVTIVVRLTKKHGPCLSFEIHRSEVEPAKMTLQDVPVEVQPIRRLLEVCEPELPDPQVKFTLPKLKVLSSWSLFCTLPPQAVSTCCFVFLHLCPFSSLSLSLSLSLSVSVSVSLSLSVSLCLSLSLCGRHSFAQVLSRALDKMKVLGDRITVTASSAGPVNFSVHTDLVSVRTSFPDSHYGQRSAAMEDEEGEAVVVDLSINAKKLANCCACVVVNPRRVDGFCIEAQALVLHCVLEHESGSMTYYCPVVDGD